MSSCSDPHGNTHRVQHRDHNRNRVRLTVGHCHRHRYPNSQRYGYRSISPSPTSRGLQVACGSGIVVSRTPPVGVLRGRCGSKSPRDARCWLPIQVLHAAYVPRSYGKDHIFRMSWIFLARFLPGQWQISQEETIITVMVSLACETGKCRQPVAKSCGVSVRMLAVLILFTWWGASCGGLGTV